MQCIHDHKLMFQLYPHQYNRIWNIIKFYGLPWLTYDMTHVWHMFRVYVQWFGKQSNTLGTGSVNEWQAISSITILKSAWRCNSHPTTLAIYIILSVNTTFWLVEICHLICVVINTCFPFSTKIPKFSFKDCSTTTKCISIICKLKIQISYYISYK